MPIVDILNHLSLGRNVHRMILSNIKVRHKEAAHYHFDFVHNA